MTLFTKRFAREAVERATKSTAQGALVAIGASDAGPVNLFELTPGPVVGVALGMGLVSLLTSVGTAKIGPEGSASAV